MEYIPLAPLLVKITALLGASLLVERFLVLFSEAINRLFIFQLSFQKTQLNKWDQRIKFDEHTTLEEAASIATNQDDDVREIPPMSSLTTEEHYESHFDVQEIPELTSTLSDEQRFECYKNQNNTRKEFWMQILGTLIAIIACSYSEFSIWIFVRFANGEAQSLNGLNNIEPLWWEYIITGIIIGSGSKPIHFLMEFLLNRKIEVQRQNTIEEARKSSSITADQTFLEKKAVKVKPQLPPAVLSVQAKSIEERIGFEYDGGDRPNRLENTHLFKSKVDLLVYHHTTLHADAPFEELVKEFDRKKWLTGYNCVVFKDGAIRVLCRWDRFGNHALPHNNHSLGLALQGNFEANPNIPFSNPDGSKGIQFPTLQQIEACARVTALWTHMWGMQVTFPNDATNLKGTIPHNLIANKACPGGNFPHEVFQNKVKHYYDCWEQDKDFAIALEEFKKQPLVMPK